MRGRYSGSRPVGWRGHSHEHSMAAKGIRIYPARKRTLIDPIFYAKKREEQVSSWELVDAIRQGMTYPALLKKYPGADAEDVRRRGIRSMDMMHGSNVLSHVNSSGVDAIVKEARESPAFRAKVESILVDTQKRSFIQGPKAEALMKRLGEIPR